MPASMITACVAFRPKVTGNRIEMPDSGPMPGRTPTSVPTRQPMNAYQRLSGAKATEKPCSRLMSVLSMMRGLEGACGKRRLQQEGKADVSDTNDADAVDSRTQRVLPFDDDEQRRHHQDHGDEEAELGVERDGNGGDDDHRQRVLAVVPGHRGERTAFPGTDEQR